MKEGVMSEALLLSSFFFPLQLLTITVFWPTLYSCLPWPSGGVKYGGMPRPVLISILRVSMRDQCRLLRSPSEQLPRLSEESQYSSKKTSHRTSDKCCSKTIFLSIIKVYSSLVGFGNCWNSCWSCSFRCLWPLLRWPSGKIILKLCMRNLPTKHRIR